MQKITVCNNTECPSKEKCLLYNYVNIFKEFNYVKNELQDNKLACNSFIILPNNK